MAHGLWLSWHHHYMLNSLHASPGPFCFLHLDIFLLYVWGFSKAPCTFMQVFGCLCMIFFLFIREDKSWASRRWSLRIIQLSCTLCLPGSSAMGFIQAGAWREQNRFWLSLKLCSWILLCSFGLGSWVSSREIFKERCSGTSVLTSFLVCRNQVQQNKFPFWLIVHLYQEFINAAISWIAFDFQMITEWIKWVV